MGKSAWEYTLEIISLATEIDELNSKLKFSFTSILSRKKTKKFEKYKNK